MNKALLSASCALALFFVACSGKTETPKKAEAPAAPQAVDYTKTENWVRKATNPGASVDAFFVYPTVCENQPVFCAPSDSFHRAEAEKLVAAHMGIFDTANFFAPFYNQLDLKFQTQSNPDTVFAAYKRIPLPTVQAAFEEMLKTNNGKPIIFGSHSQGSFLTQALLLWLKEAHPDVLKRTIAVYMIGAPTTAEYIAQLGMPFASKANDVGVIVSYNTEKPEAPNNPFTTVGANILAINPINWTTDTTLAPASANLGSLIRKNGIVTDTVKNYADAQVLVKQKNSKRVVANTAAEANPAYWPQGVLHSYDMDLYYFNLQRNVRDRVQAWGQNQD
jgi:hypothetical protein